MAIYKGYEYYKDADGVWVVVLEGGGLFMPGVDDSKLSGSRKFDESANKEKYAKKFIDLMVKADKKRVK